jgi:hypothetical protein
MLQIRLRAGELSPGELSPGELSPGELPLKIRESRLV